MMTYDDNDDSDDGFETLKPTSASVQQKANLALWAIGPQVPKTQALQ